MGRRALADAMLWGLVSLGLAGTGLVGCGSDGGTTPTGGSGGVPADTSEGDGSSGDGSESDTDATECTTAADCDAVGLGLCQVVVCNAGTCEIGDADEGTPCDDGDACTEGDACSAGTCAGTAKDCTDDDACTTESCNPDTGECVVAPGVPCDDGDACTDDSCDPATGECAFAPVELECDDGDPCTDDGCEPATGECASEAGEDGTPCDDGDLCTDEDSCAAGVCVGSTVECEDDGNACTTEACDGDTGECTATPNEGLACDDDDPCTTDDTCDASGGCAGAAKDCEDGEGCTVNGCDPVSGDCTTDPTAANGWECDDGDACTESDACSDGACAGTPLDCSDGDVCTQDLCDGGVCSNPPETSGTPCDDGDLCTLDTTCQAGDCEGTAACDDGNECTLDICDPATGDCTNLGFTLNGQGCFDDDLCTFGDVCVDGACEGTPTDCDDGDQCTVDTCDPATGECVFDGAASEGEACDDGDACTEGDVCTGGGCAGAVVQCPVGEYCDSAGIPGFPPGCVPNSGDSCGEPMAVGALPWTTAGETLTASDSLFSDEASCGVTGGIAVGDRVWIFTPPESASYLIQLEASFDAALYVLDESCDTGSCLSGTGDGSELSLSVPLEAGADYFIVVDGMAPGEVGSFSLSVAAPCQPVCAGECGADGCGGSCGSCSSTQTCDAGTCVAVPTTCAPAGAVVCGDTLSGLSNHIDSSFAFFDYTCSAQSWGGKELTHSFVAPGEVRVTVSGGFDGPLDLFLLEDTGGGCDPATVNCAATSPDELTFDAVGGQTYYLVWDSLAQDVGTDSFSMSVSCCDPNCTEPGCGVAGIDGCCQSELLVNNFDVGGLTGWEVTPAVNGVGWQVVVSDTTPGPPTALYYGNPVTGNFDSGEANAGSVTSPPIELPEGVEISLSMSAFFDTETGGSYDQLNFLVLEEGVPPTLIGGKSLLTPQAWTDISIDMSAWAGRTVQIQISFDSIDGIANEGQGVFIDNLLVGSTCAPKTCGDDLDCPAPGQCDGGSCNGGICEYTNICCQSDAECDDGQLCTADFCDVVCQNVPEPGCCDTDQDCNDGSSCTVDTCSGPGGTCGYTPVGDCCETDAQCADFDDCTVDSCVLGVCLHQNTCCTDDAECDAGACGVGQCLGGVCSVTPAPGCGAFFDFESDLPLEVTSSTAECTWQLWAAPEAFAGAQVLYYGNPATSNFECGANNGTVLLPSVSLTSGVDYTLSFWLYIDTEGGTTYDQLYADVVGSDDTVTEVWSKASLGPADYQSWTQIEIDLTPWGGSDIQVQFRFDTGDAVANDGLGVLIDDLQVASSCSPLCAIDDECPPGQICGAGGLCLPSSGDDCASARVVDELPYFAIGDTLGAADDFAWSAGSCGQPGGGFGAGGPDEVYEFTPPEAANYTITLTSTFLASFYLATDCADTDGSCVLAAEGLAEPGINAVFSGPLPPGAPLYLVVDGFDDTEAGDYVLQISGPCTPVCTGNCGGDGCGGSCGTCDLGQTCLDGTCGDPGTTCAVAGTIECGDTVGGLSTTSNSTAAFSSYTCDPGSWEGLETTLSFNSPQDALVTVQSIGASPLSLFVLQDEGNGCDPGSTCVGTGELLTSFDATAGQTYYLVWDSPDTSSADDFAVAIDCCVPSCEGPFGDPKVCGDDGCGGSCGTCGPDEVCDDFIGSCEPVDPGAACANPIDEPIIFSDVFWTEVQDCALGCIGGPTECGAECAADSLGTSPPCSICVGDLGDCIVSNCVGECLADPNDPVCVDCIFGNCVQPWDECAGVPLPPPFFP